MKSVGSHSLLSLLSLLHSFHSLTRAELLITGHHLFWRKPNLSFWTDTSLEVVLSQTVDQTGLTQTAETADPHGIGNSTAAQQNSCQSHSITALTHCTHTLRSHTALTQTYSHKHTSSGHEWWRYNTNTVSCTLMAITHLLHAMSVCSADATQGSAVLMASRLTPPLDSMHVTAEDRAALQASIQHSISALSTSIQEHGCLGAVCATGRDEKSPKGNRVD